MHYPRTAEKKQPARAYAAATTDAAHTAAATVGKGDKKGKKGKGDTKGKKGDGKGPTDRGFIQCIRCVDKANKHAKEDCPHAGKDKGLTCSKCQSTTHDSAACWTKHAGLKELNSRPKGKGKGKESKGGKPSGNKGAPAGGAPPKG
jgi:hypothetical protein